MRKKHAQFVKLQKNITIVGRLGSSHQNDVPTVTLDFGARKQGFSSKYFRVSADKTRRICTDHFIAVEGAQRLDVKTNANFCGGAGRHKFSNERRQLGRRAKNSPERRRAPESREPVSCALAIRRLTAHTRRSEAASSAKSHVPLTAVCKRRLQAASTSGADQAASNELEKSRKIRSDARSHLATSWPSRTPVVTDNAK